MRTAILALTALLLLASPSAASDARAEGKPAGAPARISTRDAVGGTVESAHTVTGQLKRVVIVRLKYNTDMLEGLRAAVAREQIKNAVILSGAGSLVSYHVHVVSNTTLPATEAFFKGEGPYDLLTTTGYIIDGRVHAHISFADTQKAMGGHLEPGTRVFTFAIITLGVLDERTSLNRFDDSSWH